LEVLGGANRHTRVTGPLGEPVEASWRLEGDRAVIKAAAAAGLALAGGPGRNDPLAATSTGVGELIAAAVDQGAREVIVGVGGSASTDGGTGAVSAIGGRRFAELGLTVRVACDVTTSFLDAARVFAPQKGADPAQVETLTARLAGAADEYRKRFGVDVTRIVGSGAAGGLAGGLAALGAHLESGFELVAAIAGLDDALGAATGGPGRDRPLGAVATGEGLLDRTSLAGKVVGGVSSAARRLDLPVLAVVGNCALEPTDAPAGVEVVSLTATFGESASWSEPARLVTEATGAWLEALRAD
jgi:glycerate kinase